MRGPNYAELLVLLFLCSATTICFAFNLSDSEVIMRCIEEERQALLKFKQGLEDNFSMLSSWGSDEEDCCKWEGIKCSNQTGHVEALDLSSKSLSGEIRSSLLGLQHLTYLDLSYNYFSILPKFIGSLTKLQYLNLSHNYFFGTIPPQLGNLTNLISLDISGYADMLVVGQERTGFIPTDKVLSLTEDYNLDWLFHLSSLRHLDMSGVNLSKVVNWPDKVNMLPSLLQDLRLSSCQLSMPVPPTLINPNCSSPLSFLDLSLNYQFNSSIFPWLFKYYNRLVYLELSFTKIGGLIPKAFGNMTALVHLGLYDTEIEGLIPKALGNMVALVHLDLSYNKLEGVIPNLSKLSLLRELFLSNNQLNGSLDNVLRKLSKLQVLDLSFNSLKGVITETHLSSLSSLNQLDLSYNYDLSLKFSPDWIPPFHLAYIGLRSCKLGPTFPQWIQTQKNFSLLEISNATISDTIPNWFWNLSSKLLVLDLSFNSLKGVITETHLLNLSSLNQLDLSYNYDLSLKFSPDWIPPFHLDYIGLGSCKLGPTFPQWIQTQKNFSLLDISNARISDTIPNWFWDLSFNIKYLNISANQITGTIPFEWFSARFQYSDVIDLSYNRFSCPLPQLNFDLAVLNLSNNLFQGTITISCESDRFLKYLDLSNNLLSGELPKCWQKIVSLEFLNLANNNLSGRIPESFGKICWKYSHLASLHFQNNNFIGELPVSLMNCSSLSVIDFGENKLSGRIPTWIGTSLPQLVILRLPSNKFVGSIPLQLCQLTSLQILDISHNSISGTIPRCINNFTGMTQKQNLGTRPLDYGTISSKGSYHFVWQYIEKARVNTKGMALEYKKILYSVKVIDLSSNRLEGEIPREVTSLLGLIGLNLSRNLLTGIIPQNIGDLKSLESLDLSSNHLSYVIPQSLATLSFLSYLNLSNNNLSGRVPTGTQLQSFTASSYAGNLDLCGLPLNRCLEDNTALGPQIGSTHEDGNIEEHENSHEHLWFYTSIAIGFIVGFWGVCGSLILKITWRHAYFQFLDRMGDRLFVTIVVNMAKLLRNFKTQCYQENV